MILDSLANTLFENVQHSHGLFSKHFHETYTLGITHSGVFKSMRLKESALSYKHSTRIINPSEVHFGDSNSWKYTNIYPSVSLMAEIYEQIYFERKIPLFQKHIIEDIKLYSLLYSFFYSVFSKEEAISIETKLIEAFSYLIINYATCSKKLDILAHDTKIIQESMEFINDNLQENIMLDDLAQNFDLSKFHYLRVFKNHLGMTPHHYILTQRVNLAKNEILQGKSLSVAALDAGFSDQSHFARNFKKIYGYAPGELLNKSNFILYM